jgi:hypothetical protein
LAATHTDLLPSLFPSTSLHQTSQHNPELVKRLLETIAGHSDAAAPVARYLDAVGKLALALPSLELLSKLLREPGPLSDAVRLDSLGPFITRAFDHVDGLEARSRAGEAQVETEIARSIEIVSRLT